MFTNLLVTVAFCKYIHGSGIQMSKLTRGFNLFKIAPEQAQFPSHFFYLKLIKTVVLSSLRLSW